MSAAFDCPIFLNCRDRVTDLRKMVDWLEKAGHQKLVLLDNDSSWPPLLEYFEQTPHEVRKLGKNLGSKSIWLASLVPQKEFWVFSDPDIVPIEECPANAVSYLRHLLEMHPTPKAGLGLYLKDVPEAMQSYAWEQSLMSNVRQIRQGVFDSLIDTSFALYRPGAKFAMQALRTDYPYMARHSAWYTYGQEISEEDQYYLGHAIQGPQGSSWAEGRQV